MNHKLTPILEIHIETDPAGTVTLAGTATFMWKITDGLQTARGLNRSRLSPPSSRIPRHWLRSSTATALWAKGCGMNTGCVFDFMSWETVGKQPPLFFRSLLRKTKRPPMKPELHRRASHVFMTSAFAADSWRPPALSAGSAPSCRKNGAETAKSNGPRIFMSEGR